MTAATNGSYSFEIIYRDDAAVDVSSIDGCDVARPRPQRIPAHGDADRRGRSERRARARRALQGRRPRRHVGPARQRAVPRRAAGRRGLRRLRERGRAASSASCRSPSPAPPRSGPAIGLYGLDPSEFGAYPDDGVDDTAGIQAAINWLPQGDGVPIGSSPVGGVVLLREGVYDTSNTIWLHSGVTLRGAGPQTVVRNGGPGIYTTRDRRSTARSRTASTSASASSTSRSTRCTAAASRSTRAWTATSGPAPRRPAHQRAAPAIDLQAAERSTTASIDNVEVYNPGSAALRFGQGRRRRTTSTASATSASPATRPVGLPQPSGRWSSINARRAHPGRLPSARAARASCRCSCAGGTTFNGLELDVPAADCPGGYAAVFSARAPPR